MLDNFISNLLRQGGVSASSLYKELVLKKGKDTLSFLVKRIEQNYDVDTKRKIYDLLVKAVPSNNVFRYNLVMIYLSQEKIEETISLAKPLYFSSPNFWHRFKYIEILDLVGDKEKALSLLLNLSEGITLTLIQAKMLNEKQGDLYKKLNQQKEAFLSYIKGLESIPGDTALYFKIATLLKDSYSEDVCLYIRTERNVPRKILGDFIELKSNNRELSSDLLGAYGVYTKNSEALLKTYEKPKGYLGEEHYFFANYKNTIQWKSFSTSLNNATCYADESCSYVMTADGDVVNDISIGGFSIIRELKDLSSPHQLNGHVAFLSQYFGAPNYCHWMLDILPRIGTLLKSGYKIDDFDHWVFNNANMRFQKDSLSLLGISGNSIVTSREFPLITADRVTVPSVGIHPGNGGSSNVIEFLCNTFLPEEIVKPYKRVYLSREGAAKRKIINGKELEAFLISEYDFEIVDPATLSVQKQAKLASEADVIVSPHGAGLTNIVFCQSSAKVIEIVSPVYATSSFFTIARAKELNYHILLGDDYDDSLSKVNLNRPNSMFGSKNILVDIEKLRFLLTEVIKKC